MANLEQSASRIPDAWSVKLTFSLTATFCITKTENRTQLLRYCTMFEKNTEISKIKGVLVLKDIFLNLHVYVHLRTKFQAFSIILTSFRQGGGVILPSPRKTHP